MAKKEFTSKQLLKFLRKAKFAFTVTNYQVDKIKVKMFILLSSNCVHFILLGIEFLIITN